MKNEVSLWIIRTKLRQNTDLESGRDPLVHLQELFGAVQGAVVLSPRHLPTGKVPNAIVETDFAQLVVVGQEVLESPELIHVRNGCCSSSFTGRHYHESGRR